ncbi:F-box protein CPR1-like [Juglans microcarpa x Juglans regia]|uniref:F-box protein CPR1-like n=1 Tax=Juglans microcarpa x Juglans regia TaxID=2249226 RepID=UPI001B7F4C0B|nr:F-box protein CPR1-like [Juglans microcarpa x Juglans regia]
MADPPPPTLNSYIPEEIVLEILARLPVKSLLSFRRVCKSWNSIISSPYFIATHLKYGPRRGYYLLYQSMQVAQIHEPSCTVVCDRTYDRISEIELPFVHAGIVGSSNGLLCVEPPYGYLSLWNPSIARFKVLPAPCLAGGYISVAYGFTYVSEENDFKIVRISYSEFTTTLPRAQVFTLSSNSWRRIDDPIPLKPNALIYNIGCNHLPCPCIAGALHWIVRSKGSEDDGRDNKKILSFDLRDEKFGEIALPSSYMYHYDEWEYLGLFKGKLASFRFADHYRCGIWAMTDYGMAESWTLLRTVEFEPGVIDFLGCTDDGGAVVIARMCREFCTVSFIETEEASHRERILLDGLHHLVFAAPFVESLALLDGSESVRI